MRIRVDLVRDTESKIIYPDDPAYFTNVVVFSTYLEADYSGQMSFPPASSETTYLGSTITKLAFKNRFTDEELEWIELTAIDVPTASIEERRLSAKLRIFLGKLSDSTFINLKRPETIGGVTVVLNLMKDSPLMVGYDQVKINTRIQEILNNPVAAIEVPITVK